MAGITDGWHRIRQDGRMAARVRTVWLIDGAWGSRLQGSCKFCKCSLSMLLLLCSRIYSTFRPQGACHFLLLLLNRESGTLRDLCIFSSPSWPPVSKIRSTACTWRRGQTALGCGPGPMSLSLLASLHVGASPGRKQPHPCYLPKPAWLLPVWPASPLRPIMP